MMIEQRAVQASRPKDEKVYIGGKILIHQLSRLGFEAFALVEFEDYESTQRAIYENFDTR